MSYNTAKRGRLELPRWSWRTALITGAVIVSLVLAGLAVVRISRDNASNNGRVSTDTRPDQATHLELDGMRLEIPNGAVKSQTKAHMTLDKEDPIPLLSADAAKLLRPVGRAVTVDLSGQQPAESTPLTLTVPVPDGADTQSLVMVTNHQGEPGTLVGQYDPTRRTFTVSLTQLSGFRLAVLNPSAVIEAVKEYLSTLLNVADDNQQPQCFTKPVTLPDGSTVGVKSLDTPELLWPCITVRAGKVLLTVHSGSGAFWRVRTPSGQYQGAAEVPLGDAVKQALFETLLSNKELAEGLILPRGEASWLFDPAKLPTVFQAQMSQGAWLADSVLFTVTLTIDLATHAKASNVPELAKRYSKLDGISECVDKAGKILADGARATAESLGHLTQAALDCKDLVLPLFGPVAGLVAQVVGIVVGGAAVLGEAMETMVRNVMRIGGDEAALDHRWQITIDRPGPVCPPAGEVATVLGAQSPFWHAGDTVESVVCAGPYARAVIDSQPQGYQVLLQIQGSGWKYLKSGSGPICSVFPDDAASAMVVVPPKYGEALDCIVSR